jgi:hypothetical protein
MSRSKKVVEYPIQKSTTLEDMLMKLREDKLSGHSSGEQPIYIKEEFTVTESEDRPRTELRSHLKRMQKQRLLADGDFVCLAHLVRHENISALVDLLSKVRVCRSELDRISLLSKRFQKVRTQLASKLTLDAIVQVEFKMTQMLEDMAKIKLITLKTVSEVVSALEKHSSTRKMMLNLFTQLLVGQTTLRSIMYIRLTQIGGRP